MYSFIFIHSFFVQKSWWDTKIFFKKRTFLYIDFYQTFLQEINYIFEYKVLELSFFGHLRSYKFMYGYMFITYAFILYSNDYHSLCKARQLFKLNFLNFH